MKDVIIYDMTLKEKLFNAVFDNAWEYKHENTIPELEKIADDYAIDFIEWYFNLTNEYIAMLSAKKLLEIYKKEKGL